MRMCIQDTSEIEIIMLVLFLLVTRGVALSLNNQRDGSFLTSHKTYDHFDRKVENHQLLEHFSSKSTQNVSFIQSCSSIKYSLTIQNNSTQKTECICPNKTKKYQTKDGQKCLSPQPVEYPEFVDLTCGFLTFLVPAIVAYVCRHKEELQRERLSIHHLGRRKGGEERESDKQMGQGAEGRLQNIERKIYSSHVNEPMTLNNNRLPITSRVQDFRIVNDKHSSQKQVKVKENKTFRYSSINKPKYASAIDIQRGFDSKNRPINVSYASSIDQPVQRSKYAVSWDRNQ